MGHILPSCNIGAHVKVINVFILQYERIIQLQKGIPVSDKQLCALHEELLLLKLPLH